ncbi:hypothetical protein ACFFRR_002299 [Megaselia abdita]
MGAPGKGPFECCGKTVCQDNAQQQADQPHPPPQPRNNNINIQQQDNQNNNVLPEQPQDHQNNNHIYVNPTANFVDYTATGTGTVTLTTTTTSPSFGSISVPQTAATDDDTNNNNNSTTHSGSLSRQLTSTTLNTYLFPLDVENNNSDNKAGSKATRKFNLFAKLAERMEPKITEETEKEKAEKEKKKSSVGPPKAVRAQAGRQMDNDPLQGRQRKVNPAKGKKSKDKEKDFYKDLEKYTQHFNLFNSRFYQ